MATKDENDDGLWLTKEEVTIISDDLQNFATAL